MTHEDQPLQPPADLKRLALNVQHPVMLVDSVMLAHIDGFMSKITLGCTNLQGNSMPAVTLVISTKDLQAMQEALSDALAANRNEIRRAHKELDAKLK